MRGITLNAYAELQIIKQLRIDVFLHKKASLVPNYVQERH